MRYGIMDIGRNIFGRGSRPGHLRTDEFWAVDDVSFEVKRGETLGLIGPNGSGKTTLLKMINGIFWPDKGRVKVKGRVGALIAVGAGFHPLLTGRENIYVNGAILGMSKKEIQKKFDSIVDFADIGDFLDAPVKHYSSGMYVRLGFAIAVHSEPDILLVDEILAVGDKDFSIKCYQKMHDIKRRGTTIILVSHNVYTIRENTNECIYLEKGKMRFKGDTEKAITLYTDDTYQRKGSIFPAPAKTGECLNKKAELLSLKFLDSDWNEISHIESGQELNILLDIVARERIQNMVIGINFYSNDGFLYCANSDYEDIHFGEIFPGRMRLRVNIPEFHLPINHYLCSTILAEDNSSNLIDWHNMIYSIMVGRARNARGSIRLRTSWDLEALDHPEGRTLEAGLAG